jgi:hypothetical protein
MRRTKFNPEQSGCQIFIKITNAQIAKEHRQDK